jgi:hypothetical protein
LPTAAARWWPLTRRRGRWLDQFSHSLAGSQVSTQRQPARHRATAARPSG